MPISEPASFTCILKYVPFDNDIAYISNDLDYSVLKQTVFESRNRILQRLNKDIRRNRVLESNNPFRIYNNYAHILLCGLMVTSNAYRILSKTPKRAKQTIKTIIDELVAFFSTCDANSLFEQSLTSVLKEHAEHSFKESLQSFYQMQRNTFALLSHAVLISIILSSKYDPVDRDFKSTVTKYLSVWRNQFPFAKYGMDTVAILLWIRVHDIDIKEMLDINNVDFSQIDTYNTTLSELRHPLTSQNQLRLFKLISSTNAFMYIRTLMDRDETRDNIQTILLDIHRHQSVGTPTTMTGGGGVVSRNKEHLTNALLLFLNQPPFRTPEMSISILVDVWRRFTDIQNNYYSRALKQGSAYRMYKLIYDDKTSDVLKPISDADVFAYWDEHGSENMLQWIYTKFVTLGFEQVASFYVRRLDAFGTYVHQLHEELVKQSGLYNTFVENPVIKDAHLIVKDISWFAPSPLEVIHENVFSRQDPRTLLVTLDTKRQTLMLYLMQALAFTQTSFTTLKQRTHKNTTKLVTTINDSTAILTPYLSDSLKTALSDTITPEASLHDIHGSLVKQNKALQYVIQNSVFSYKSFVQFMHVPFQFHSHAIKQVYHECTKLSIDVDNVAPTLVRTYISETNKDDQKMETYALMSTKRKISDMDKPSAQIEILCFSYFQMCVQTISSLKTMTQCITALYEGTKQKQQSVLSSRPELNTLNNNPVSFCDMLYKLDDHIHTLYSVVLSTNNTNLAKPNVPRTDFIRGNASIGTLVAPQSGTLFSVTDPSSDKKQMLDELTMLKTMNKEQAERIKQLTQTAAVNKERQDTMEKSIELLKQLTLCQKNVSLKTTVLQDLQLKTFQAQTDVELIANRITKQESILSKTQSDLESAYARLSNIIRKNTEIGFTTFSSSDQQIVRNKLSNMTSIENAVQFIEILFSQSLNDNHAFSSTSLQSHILRGIELQASTSTLENQKTQLSKDVYLLNEQKQMLETQIAALDLRKNATLQKWKAEAKALL